MRALLCLFATLFILVPAAGAEGQARWFILGDSLSDDGASFVLHGGEDDLGGRASDGPLWHEHLNDGLLVAPGAAALAPAPDLQGRPGGPLAGGVNFAHGGAETRTTSDIPGGIRQAEGLAGLVEDGEIAALTERDVIVYWLGGNDILHVLEGGETADADQMLVHVEEALAILTEVGARRVMLLGLPEMGGAFLGASLDRDAPDAAALNATVRDFNHQLRSLAQEINQEPEYEAVYIDIAELVRQIETEPERYGFTHVGLDCESLDHCGAHVFSLDGIHPTTAGHAIIAEWVALTASRNAFSLVE